MLLGYKFTYTSPPPTSTRISFQTRHSLNDFILQRIKNNTCCITVRQIYSQKVFRINYIYILLKFKQNYIVKGENIEMNMHKNQLKLPLTTVVRFGNKPILPMLQGHSITHCRCGNKVLKNTQTSVYFKAAIKAILFYSRFMLLFDNQDKLKDKYICRTTNR